MNAKSNFFIIVIIISAFLIGKQCSADIRGIGKETRDYLRATAELGEEIRATSGEIAEVGEYLQEHRERQVAVGSDWDSNRYGCRSDCDNIYKGGMMMRGGIFTLLVELVKNTPTLIEFLIISLIVFLITRLIKKSYPDLFNREIVSGVKVKFLIPVGITSFGCLFYCFLAKEPFLLALADGGMLAVMGIIWDNSWEAIKNLFKSIFGAIKR